MSTTLIGSTWIQPRSGSDDDDNNREFVRAFFVLASSPTVGPIAVLATPGIPAIGVNYEGDDASEIDIGAVVRRRNARQDSVAPQLWVVEVTYSVKPLTGNGGDPNKGDPTQQAPNPLDRPAQWELSFQEFQRPVTEGYLVNDSDQLLDAEGDPIAEEDADTAVAVAIVNSAGDPYDPPPMRDDSRIVLVVTRNEPWPADATFARAYKDAVNSDTFFGVPPGFAKVKSIRARNAYEPQIGKFIQVTYEFTIREGNFDGDNWNLNLLDAGYNQLDGSGDPVAITDKNGVAVSSPQRLNGTGVWLDNPDDPSVYRRWRIYPRKPFAALGLE